VDSGVFQAVQEAGIAALTGPQESVTQARAIYQERRDVVVAGLRKLGLPVTPPRATFFVWAPVPDGSDSRKWASRLLQEAGVVVTPGVGFGATGEGYYRIALTVDKARIAEAMDRLARLAL
jgi:LL-diaminopimelate aminotransferase